MIHPSHTALLPVLARQEPHVLPSLIFCGNSLLHDHAVRSAFTSLRIDLDLSVDANQGRLPRKTKELSLLRYPHLALHVRQLSFYDSPSRYPSSESPETIQDAAWRRASSLIGLCGRVEELRWESSMGIGGRMWKAISSLPNLKRLSLRYPPNHPSHDPGRPVVHPRLSPEVQLLLPPGLSLSEIEGEGEDAAVALRRPKAQGVGGCGLGIAWENLEVLEISGLGQQGSKTLAAHLQLLAQDLHPPSLKRISLSTQFLGTVLVAALAQLGAFQTLTHLELATTGVSLTTDGLVSILQSCTGLESVALREVVGRLDKNTWQVVTLPASLRKLEIDIAEAGEHRSWVLNHLLSIHLLDIKQLSLFSVRRIIHPIALLPFPPENIRGPRIQPTHEPQLIPQEVLGSVLENGANLESLCLDWWELELEDLERLLKAVPRIKILRLALRVSMLKVVSMINLFAGVPHLEHLSITSSPIYNTAAPTIKSDSPSQSHYSMDLPPYLAERVAVLDPTLPEVRDFRKFVRRLPLLHKLEWVGRGGKGEWCFSKSKKTALVKVEFVHSAVLHQKTWEECQLHPTAPVFAEPDTDGRVLEVPTLKEERRDEVVRKSSEVSLKSGVGTNRQRRASSTVSMPHTTPQKPPTLDLASHSQISTPASRHTASSRRSLPSPNLQTPKTPVSPPAIATKKPKEPKGKTLVLGGPLPSRSGSRPLKEKVEKMVEIESPLPAQRIVPGAGHLQKPPAPPKKSISVDNKPKKEAGESVKKKEKVREGEGDGWTKVGEKKISEKKKAGENGDAPKTVARKKK
ncbi:hypothetical protein P7C73_g2936, partial [Tremellales sp. Uapishka_1]